MNKLGKLQEALRVEGLSEGERRRREKHFLITYYRLREREERKLSSRLPPRIRRRLHGLLRGVYHLKNRLGGFTYAIVGDARVRTDRPVILSITHVGKFDIEVLSEAIPDHCHILTGDFEHLQGTSAALALRWNGVFYFNETVKSDRRAVSEKMINHLRQGGNLMYFPEGAWNLSPNLPVLPCYWGVIDIAKRGGAVIVPVAACQYGRHFDINIGQNFEVDVYGADPAEKARAISDLRDQMASLAWEIWERHPQSRVEIQANEWEDYIARRLEEWPGFTVPYIDGLTYRPKGVVAPREAFAHLERLIPCRENAFLFRNRDEYIR